jgi:hypothetical protein
VQDHKENLFVGVDEYDAPVNSCLFSTSNAPESHLEDVADLFKTEFFTVMKRACGSVIIKYWLTGVLPLFREGNSPLTATEIISMQLQFRRVCGFTEKEVQTIAENYLCPRFTPDELLRALQEMKRGYNGYQFSPQGMNTPEPCTILSLSSYTSTTSSYAGAWFIPLTMPMRHIVTQY